MALIFGAVSLIFTIISFILAVIMYIWGSLTWQRILRQVNYPTPYYAWIPFLNMYTFADLVPDTNGKIKLIDDFEVDKKIFRFWWLAVILFSFIPFIGGVCGLAISLLANIKIYSFVYSIYRGTSENDELGWSIASSFIPLIFYIKFIGLRELKKSYTFSTSSMPSNTSFIGDEYNNGFTGYNGFDNNSGFNTDKEFVDNSGFNADESFSGSTSNSDFNVFN